MRQAALDRLPPVPYLAVMALRSILIHPDPRLKKTAEPVVEFDDALRQLVEDMFETMYDAPGIGLAAPQIGVLQRVVVMDCAGREERLGEDPLEEVAEAEPVPDPITMINPEILWLSDEICTRQEGCLSIPDQFEDVTRPSQVKLRYLDCDGAAHERLFEHLPAACVQHEVDHLNGKLFLDYLGPVRRSMITQRMKKLKRERAQVRKA